MMQSDLDMLLNDLLVKWHTYCATTSTARAILPAM